MTKPYTHPPDILGPLPTAEVQAGVNSAVDKLGLDKFVTSLAVDFSNGHWHDWRIYAMTLDKIARRNAQQNKASEP